ncbi:peptidase S8/S53 domain-containing protein [Melanogaster broomeanus]|nr:peptidase S8/S53 domain-containing protein [Melanogaster broomeanus]
MLSTFGVMGLSDGSSSPSFPAAEPSLSPYNLHEKRSVVPAVSHPDSPSYGNHWSAGDVARKFAPTDETIDTVRSWLISSGISDERIAIGRTKGWIQVDATVEEAERLMNTEYNDVQPHVDFVIPTVHFDTKLTRRSGDSQPARDIGQPGVGISPKTAGTVETLVTELEQCDEYITPICLRALYGLVYVPVATELNSYGIDLIGKEPYMVSIDGGYAQTEYQGFGYNGESDLDLQYGMSLVTGAQTVTLYQTGDMVEVLAISSNFRQVLPSTISLTLSMVPYCTFEGGDDYTQDAMYPDEYPGGTWCAEYAKLGLMGVTVLYSSGDDGVAGNGNYCLNPDGSQTADGMIFNPSFPGTCPYITSVGATMVKPNASVLEPEMACMEVIYSGGGFSNYFAMPEYQKGAVDYYLTNYYPDYPATIWNSTGMSRGFPDIAANGANYVVAIDGQFELVYGTSCSSPVSGAIFTMINDARLAIGKKPIGFINPTIYSTGFAGAFNDITEGTNPGCGTAGYNATAGWDPVTGLGTPNFPKLLERWLILP